jgi:hypothetical protein
MIPTRLNNQVSAPAAISRRSVLLRGLIQEAA